MRPVLRWASLVLFALLSLFLIWFGVTYATVQDMLWFHAAAVPEALRPEMKPLYLALMKLIGGSSAALGILGAYVLAFPLRRGVAGAASALTLTYAISFVVAAFTAEKLAADTGAPTSWHIMGVLLAVTALAFLAHAVGARPRA